jgi:hypothetical protein
MTEIKLDLPKFPIESTAPIYDFGFIASALGMIPLPEGIAVRPEAIVLIEDHVFPEQEDDGAPLETEPVTLLHFANRHSIELNAEQMRALEDFIRDAQKMVADAQREMALANARQNAGNAGIANEIARKAGLIKPGR